MTRSITPEEKQQLLTLLATRFKENPERHSAILWQDVQEKLEKNEEKLFSLLKMEKSGGEPDVVGFDATTQEYLFFDCAAESPIDRRNLCYDQAALMARKKNKPQNSAVATAEAMGIQLLTEEDYRYLQTLGAFDTKTSSWLLTPEEIRTRGGALFGDRRYNHVFLYHNGADSYYSARGFRGVLRV